LEYQFANEVSAANVMHQITEFSAAEGVVAEILNYGAAIGIGVGLLDLVVRQSGESLQEKGTNFVRPEEINDFLVCQNRICEGATAIRSTTSRSADARRELRRLAAVPNKVGLLSRMTQILPRSSRITTIDRMSPTPPVGA
jgi:hypothetical protein